MSLVKYVKRIHYSTEIVSLSSGKHVAKGSCIYKLDPYLASDGVIRVLGRLGSEPPDIDKHPAILPRTHRVSRLVLQYSHDILTGHSGREHALSLMRDSFWIPKFRPLIKKVLCGIVSLV